MILKLNDDSHLIVFFPQLAFLYFLNNGFVLKVCSYMYAVCMCVYLCIIYVSVCVCVCDCVCGYVCVFV